MKLKLIALLALVTIQVGVGTIFKLAANGNGKQGYEFSKASSLACSEFFKMVLSILFFAISNNGISMRDLQESETIRQGMGMLAMGYFVNNHLAFYLFTIADPGTTNLVKASSTFISALILLKFANRHPVKLQWFAIVFQVFGLVVSQYDETNEKSAYDIGVYLLIGTSTLISSCCGCFNDHITKSTNTSLHILNAYMYCFGFVLNLAYYCCLAVTNEDEPGFFQGYSGWGLGVLICNSLIGLAITAVYKYGDAIVKCFAQSLSTCILVFLSWLLFGASIRVMMVIGGFIVFLATYLYMFPKEFTVEQPELDRYHAVSTEQESDTNESKKQYSFYIIIGLLFWTFFFLNYLMVTKSNVVVKTQDMANVAEGRSPNSSSVYENATLPISALIEFTSPRFEREQVIRKGYQGHFRTTTLNFGTGNQQIGDIEPWNNYTQRCGNWFVQYHCLGELSRVVHDQGTKGFLFFHFDLWVDPKRFSGMDFNKIWMLQGPKCADVTISNDTVMPFDNWYWWNKDIINATLTGLKSLSLGYPKYKTVPNRLNRVCHGWSDLFYIPKSMIHDFDVITKVLNQNNVFHEIGAMVAIDILQNEFDTGIELVDDCWGSAIMTANTTKEVLGSRCGHKLPLHRDDLVQAHFTRINT